MTDWFVRHWLVLTLLGAYTALLMRNAYLGFSNSGSLADYYVGSRSMSGPVVGFSFFATFASTNSYIGHAGKGYDYGLAWMVMPAMLVLFTFISWRWVGPQTRRLAARFDALTMPDFLCSRFAAQPAGLNSTLRVVSALVIVFCSLLYLIAIFKGVGHLFEHFFAVAYETAIMFALVVVVLYTSLGGFISVVRTDVMQGVLMLIGAVMIFYFVTSAVGGPGAITQLAERPDSEFLFDLNGAIPFAVLLGIALSGSLKLLVDPRQLSRFYALKDDASIRQGMWVAIIALLIVQLCLYPIGVYAHLLLDSITDTDLIIPTLVNDPSVFPVWAGDFLFVAIAAAAMSSMDSVLLVAASVSYKNLLLPGLGGLQTPRSGLLWTRSVVVGLAVLAAALALSPPGDIIEITIFSGSLYAACFFPAVVLGLHWSKGSVQAVLLSMATGVTTLGLWIFFGYSSVLHEVFPALLVSVSTYVLAASCSEQRIDLSPHWDGN